MKILNNFRLMCSVYKLGILHKDLMQTTQITDKKFKSLVGQINATEYIIKNIDNLAINTSVKELINFVKLDTQFIYHFINHEFEKSFDVALNMHEGKIPKQVVLNRRIDALMEIKARMDSSIYKEKYGETEIVLRADINACPKAAQSYNRNNMALAFGAFLDGNKEEMNHYLKKQLGLYGFDSILKREGVQEQPWYHKNVTPKYIEFLTEFFESQAPLQNNSQPRMKMA